MSRTPAALALAVAVALTAPGCSDDAPEPEPTASSETSTATPSPTPTAIAPTLPPEASTPDAAGAEAFVRYYFSVVNYAYITGDITTLQAYARPECQTCASNIATISQQYSAGATFSGGEIAVEVATSTPPTESGEVLVTTVIDQAPLQKVNPDGSLGEVSDGEVDLSLSVGLQRSSDAWAVFAIANAAGA